MKDSPVSISEMANALIELLNTDLERYEADVDGVAIELVPAEDHLRQQRKLLGVTRGLLHIVSNLAMPSISLLSWLAPIATNTNYSDAVRADIQRWLEAMPVEWYSGPVVNSSRH